MNDVWTPGAEEFLDSHAGLIRALVQCLLQNADAKDTEDGFRWWLQKETEEDDPEKEWRNRDKGIKEVTDESVGKWMPEDLMNLAKRSTKQ